MYSTKSYERIEGLIMLVLIRSVLGFLNLVLNARLTVWLAGWPPIIASALEYVTVIQAFSRVILWVILSRRHCELR